MAGPVQEVQPDFDSVLSIKTCKNVHRYLSASKFDAEGLEKLLVEHFGESEILETKSELEARFGRHPGTIRDYQTLLDAMISELYFTGDDPKARLPSYSRQATFISANNFHGLDADPFKVYVTRLVIPILQTLINMTENLQKNGLAHLKYIFLHVTE